METVEANSSTEDPRSPRDSHGNICHQGKARLLLQLQRRGEGLTARTPLAAEPSPPSHGSLHLPPLCRWVLTETLN